MPVLLSPKRFKLLACGRRWSKTGVGLTAVIEGHGAYRGQYGGALHGKKIWWVVPTFSDATEVWDNLKKAAAGVGVVREVLKRVDFPGGGSVAVKSADNPNSLRGRGLDGVVVDEAAFCSSDTWHRALRPALTDRRGWAMILSSPNGRNWFYDLFVHAGRDEAWDRWQQPTIDNPLVTLEEVEAASKEMGPTAARQEFWAEFMSGEGAEFPAEWFEDHVWFDEWPERNRLRAMSLDPSKGRETDAGDYSAFVMGAFSHDGHIYVDADLERRPPPKIVADGVRLYRRFKPDGFCLESNSWQDLLGAEFDRAFAAAGMLTFAPYLFENRVNKKVRIRRLSAWLSDGLIHFKRGSPGAKLLLEQTRDFGAVEHDDGPDALEMMIRLAQQIVADREQANDDEYETVG